MAELVTGYAGTEHITSAQVGAYNAGTFGAGKYVLDTADQLAATIIDANTIQIAAGDAIFEGRHVTIDPAETVTISSGSMGMERYDIITIHYERDGGGVETAALEVIEGTPSSGTPVLPTVPAGSILEGDADAYMSLYIVKITGLTPGTPVRVTKVTPALVDTAASLASDISTVSASLVPTAITAGSLTFNNCSQFGSSTPGYKIGRLVVVNVRLTVSGANPTVSGFPAYTAANSNVPIRASSLSVSGYMTDAGVLTVNGISSGNVMVACVYVATS